LIDTKEAHLLIRNFKSKGLALPSRQRINHFYPAFDFDRSLSPAKTHLTDVNALHGIHSTPNHATVSPAYGEQVTDFCHPHSHRHATLRLDSKSMDEPRTDFHRGKRNRE